MIEAEKGSVALVMHVSSVIGMKNGVPPLRAGQPRCRYAKLTHALEDPYRAYNLCTLIVSILCIATLIRCNAAYQTRWVSTSLVDLACCQRPTAKRMEGLSTSNPVIKSRVRSWV